MLLLDKSLEDTGKSVYFHPHLGHVTKKDQRWFERLKNPQVGDMRQCRGAKINRNMSKQNEILDHVWYGLCSGGGAGTSKKVHTQPEEKSSRIS